MVDTVEPRVIDDLYDDIGYMIAQVIEKKTEELGVIMQAELNRSNFLGLNRNGLYVVTAVQIRVLQVLQMCLDIYAEPQNLIPSYYINTDFVQVFDRWFKTLIYKYRQVISGEMVEILQKENEQNGLGLSEIVDDIIEHQQDLGLE